MQSCANPVTMRAENLGISCCSLPLASYRLSANTEERIFYPQALRFYTYGGETSSDSQDRLILLKQTWGQFQKNNCFVGVAATPQSPSHVVVVSCVSMWMRKMSISPVV